GAGCCHLQCLLSGNGLSLRADGYGRKSWVNEKSLTANPDAEQQKHRESSDQRALPVKITHNENPATKGESATIVDLTAHKIVAEEIRRQSDTVPTCATDLLVGRTGSVPFLRRNNCWEGHEFTRATSEALVRTQIAKNEESCHSGGYANLRG